MEEEAGEAAEVVSCKNFMFLQREIATFLMKMKEGSAASWGQDPKPKLTTLNLDPKP